MQACPGNQALTCSPACQLVQLCWTVGQIISSARLAGQNDSLLLSCLVLSRLVLSHLALHKRRGVLSGSYSTEQLTPGGEHCSMLCGLLLACLLSDRQCPALHCNAACTHSAATTFTLALCGGLHVHGLWRAWLTHGSAALLAPGPASAAEVSPGATNILVELLYRSQWHLAAFGVFHQHP